MLVDCCDAADWLALVGLALIVQAAVARLRAAAGEMRTKTRYRPSIRSYPFEALLILLLILFIGFAGKDWHRWFIYLVTAIGLLLVMLRGVSIREHGILAGTRFVLWSRVVGYRWLGSNSDSATLVIKPAGELPICFRIPADQVSGVDDLVSGAARPEPRSLIEIIFDWFLRLVLLMTLSLCILLLLKWSIWADA